MSDFLTTHGTPLFSTIVYFPAKFWGGRRDFPAVNNGLGSRLAFDGDQTMYKNQHVCRGIKIPSSDKNFGTAEIEQRPNWPAREPNPTQLFM